MYSEPGQQPSTSLQWSSVDTTSQFGRLVRSYVRLTNATANPPPPRGPALVIPRDTLSEAQLRMLDSVVGRSLCAVRRCWATADQVAESGWPSQLHKDDGCDLFQH